MGNYPYGQPQKGTFHPGPEKGGGTGSGRNVLLTSLLITLIGFPILLWLMFQSRTGRLSLGTIAESFGSGGGLFIIALLVFMAVYGAIAANGR